MRRNAPPSHGYKIVRTRLRNLSALTQALRKYILKCTYMMSFHSPFRILARILSHPSITLRHTLRFIALSMLAISWLPHALFCFTALLLFLWIRFPDNRISNISYLYRRLQIDISRHYRIYAASSLFDCAFYYFHSIVSSYAHSFLAHSPRYARRRYALGCCRFAD